ncbi:HAMP domain-containing sensor histidine kinase [Clostridium oryzae]|uniref:histidine kinase n=1 Tax=Clostridium oryzae TaxID=1450648 RepID=A0A1V4IDD8_9CLOT|nr:HAMP domain-containing sensor histidine kinase [Clostridium oryzae]OPJ57981.1 sensor histidine kinase CssS [Clostridium oryzae]
MKLLKFKSLTMRIWTTFTSIILIIVISISLIYILAYRRINQDAKAHDLKVAHDILLQNKNFNEPNNFGELKNLIGSEHFVYSIISRKTINIKRIDRSAPIEPEDYMHKSIVPPPINDKRILDLENWMASFINKSKVHDLQLRRVYNGKKFIFIISSMTGYSPKNSYLISYIPEIQDNSILYLVITIGFVFICIGFFTSKIVANYISKPLKELEAFTIRISQKDWNKPIEIKNEDEIGRLAASMNRMQRELKLADDEEKMFLQSISHDLKTPVMVIMSHADAIIDGVYIDSVEKTAEIIKNESIRLNKKVKQLLYLNTLNYVLENDEENIKINLKQLLLDIINRFEIINSAIEWDLQLNNALITANLEKIQVCIENILDNSLRYCYRKISVSLELQKTFAVIKIYNDGPTIDKIHLNKIFNNLYKDKTGNFGLGLAISKKIITFYKGSIKAQNHSKGVSFIIKLPQ